LLDRLMEGGMTDHDEACARDDLFDVRVLPVPSLDLVFRGLASMHAGIKPERLDDERSRLSRDAEALLFPGFHAFDEIENVQGRRMHVLILFTGAQESRPVNWGGPKVGARGRRQ
jgi:hypothetical protein